MKKNKLEMLDNKNDKKLFAFLAVFLSIIGFILALLVKKDDNYVMFYAKESLVIFIGALLVGGIDIVMRLIPVIGGIISFVLFVFLILIWIITMIYSLSGKEKPTPLVIDFAKMINL